MRRFAAPLWLACVLAAPLAAQGGTGVVAGRVLDEGGRGLAGVAVAGDDGQRARTDSAGAFALRGVRCGDYRVTARRPGTIAVTRLVEPCAPGADAVALVLQPLATLLDPVAVRATVTGVTGLVVDADGTPRAGVAVQLVGHGDSVRTDATGRFRLLDVAPGAWLLRTRADSLPVRMLSVRLAPGEVRDFVVVLPPPGAPRRGRPMEPHDDWVADMARRIAAHPGFDAVVSREELLATGEPQLGCALAQVATVRRRFPALHIGNCREWTPPPDCILRNGWLGASTPFPLVRVADVEFVELYDPRGANILGLRARANRCDRAEPVVFVGQRSP